MKTSSIAVETSRSTTQSDSIVRQTNKRSSYLSYTTMNNKHIFNDISKVVATIGEDVYQALVGLYSFTWCDTVGVLMVKANSSLLKIVKSDNDAKQAFTELSQSWDLSEDLFRSIEKVTCSFYSSGANASDVNDLRYNLFFAKNGEIESYQLPPCKDCLRKHTMRAN